MPAKGLHPTDLNPASISSMPTKDRMQIALDLLHEHKGQVSMQDLADACGYSQWQGFQTAWGSWFNGLSLTQFRIEQGWEPYLKKYKRRGEV